MAHMTIMRGGPGSGKSWFVADLIPKSIGPAPPTICSADEFFINDAGEYDFDPKWLGRAHGACLKKCVEAIMRREDIIIDNTNSKPQEMLPYLALCQAFSYSCAVVRVLCDPEVAWSRQTHAVPRDKFDDIHITVAQQKVPKLYKDAPWLICKDVRTGPHYSSRPKIYEPCSGARCSLCGGVIVYSSEAGETYRYCDHEADTCECQDGSERPGEPFPGLPVLDTLSNVECNCGVTRGLRSNHESQCPATYISRCD
jgi:predicted kinase